MRAALRLALGALLVLAQAAPALARPSPGHVTIPTFPIESPPRVTAPSWIVYDDTYGLVLAERNADEARPMASTTKIMTALLALESGDLDRMVTVSERAAEAGEAEIGLVAGERIRMRDLVKTLLIRSANDAAVAVAEAVAGSVEGFVAMMNERAEELGLANTHFANPHGLDDPEHYSSARDLLILARAAMQIPEFAEAVATTRFEFPDAPDGTHRVAEATNHLLEEYEGAIGVKTGYTFQAKLVLVGAAERNGRRLYAVVMGSEGERAHFRDAMRLLDHGFGEFGVVPTVMAGISYSRRGGGADLLARTALAETRMHLAAMGLGGTGDPPPLVEASEKGPEPTLVASASDPLPGLQQAFAWASHYWQWLVGDG